VDKIDDWYRYFGDSTVYHCGKSGLSVHLPDTGKPDSASREQDGSEREDSGRLESDNAGDNVE
jgi:hypothetical protein